MNRKLLFRGGLRAVGGSACLLMVLLVGARAVDAQPPIEILEPIESLDREVVLRWTRAPGDTFTATQRRTIRETGFFGAKLQGFTANQFRNATLIAGRGASVPGSQNGVIELGAFADLYPASTPPPPPAEGPTFSVVGVFQFGRDRIGVAFSQSVDPGSGAVAGNYSVTPGIAVASARIQENGRTVILETAPNLSGGTSYSVTVGGVTNTQGAALDSGGPFPFDAPSVVAPVNISELWANPTAFAGQTVTVFGQPTIPTGARGAPANGFIQDGSGRGIRLRGGSVLDPVNSRSNAAVVTGTVVSSPRLEITGYTAATTASALPALGPRVLTHAQSQSRAYEGTFVETQGYLSRVDASSDETSVRFYTVPRDTLFTGYQVWRASEEDPSAFALLRTYSLLDSTWTFTGPDRVFADPDSLIPRGTERDPEREPGALVPGPFNGFGYLYSVTWFDGVVDATVFPFRVTLFDSLSGAEGAVSSMVYPTPEARQGTPLLGQVRVVPNPYNPKAPFGQQVFPGPPRVQFVNMPTEALVKIYTAAGDLVREIEKAPDPGDDSVVWDLKNQDGRDVAAGVYLYYIKSGSEEIRGHFVIAR